IPPKQTPMNRARASERMPTLISVVQLATIAAIRAQSESIGRLISTDHLQLTTTIECRMVLVDCKWAIVSGRMSNRVLATEPQRHGDSEKSCLCVSVPLWLKEWTEEITGRGNEPNEPESGCN